MFCFLNNRISGENLLKISHIDIVLVKKEISNNKELRQFVRDSRKIDKKDVKEKKTLIEFDLLEDIFVEY